MAGDLHLRPVVVVQVVVGEGTAQEVIGNLCPPRPGEVHGADATVGGPAAELGRLGGRDWVVARVPALASLLGEEPGVGGPSAGLMANTVEMVLKGLHLSKF